MANLRGGSYEKQTKDAFHRVEKFGSAKRDHELPGQTHSIGTAKSRMTELKKFSSYLKNNDFTCKMNTLMNSETLDAFFIERLSGLTSSTIETKLRTWSSLIEGLKERNVTINLDKKYFDEKVQELRDKGAIREAKTDQAIENVEYVLDQLYDHRHESGVYAEVLLELGVRNSEAIELITNPQHYITVSHDKYQITNLIGKGNHQYEYKTISPELVRKIESVRALPSKSTLYRDLKRVGINAHRFRYSFAKEKINTLFKMGLHYREVYKTVSKELNHHRAEMTQYYYVRA